MGTINLIQKIYKKNSPAMHFCEKRSWRQGCTTWRLSLLVQAIQSMVNQSILKDVKTVNMKAVAAFVSRKSKANRVGIISLSPSSSPVQPPVGILCWNIQGWLSQQPNIQLKFYFLIWYMSMFYQFATGLCTILQ